jgi:hypothetical protein
MLSQAEQTNKRKVFSGMECELRRGASTYLALEFRLRARKKLRP